ncbi:uncharacterized protein TRIADDRAFT_62091 [Trichoplax adhaerens]|uniref:G-protein coupled receptors family 1 profile domain-containing protein n=1 Tax=Trichoplax adhaerens TaxID=10228 RepID=B3SCT6_TRIAD|nr:predicted protein [Trichoplax adhaerens]EDV19466.1 predicted protein [Trichoplax adhaerens]|eukprot:XP_002118066.1 predicted protein [Trichoplax adhaerens]
MRVTVISDIICTIASFIGYIQVASRQLDYYGGTMMCRVSLYFTFTSYGISMMNLCLIGIDRYYSMKPFSNVYGRNKNRILIFGEVAIAISSASVTAPVIVFVRVHHNDTLQCDIPEITPSISAYLIAFTIIEFFLPAILIIVIYWKIIKLQKSYITPKDAFSVEREEDSLRKKRFIKMLLSISVSYILISWPFFASMVGLAITRQSFMDVRMNNIGYFLLLFFSLAVTTSTVILNPFIYLKFDKRIRYGSVKLIKRLIPYQCTRQIDINNFNSAISNSYPLKVEHSIYLSNLINSRTSQNKC